MRGIEIYRLYELNDNLLISRIRKNCSQLIGKPDYQFDQFFADSEINECIPGINKTFLVENPSPMVRCLAEQLPPEYLITPMQRFIVYCNYHRWHARVDVIGRGVNVCVKSNEIYNHDIKVFSEDTPRFY